MQDPNAGDFHVVGERPAHEEGVAHRRYLNDAAILVTVGIDAFAEVNSRRIQLLGALLRGRPVGGSGGPSKGETERHGDYQGSHHHSSSGRVTAKNGPPRRTRASPCSIERGDTTSEGFDVFP